MSNLGSNGDSSLPVTGAGEMSGTIIEGAQSSQEAQVAYGAQGAQGAQVVYSEQPEPVAPVAPVAPAAHAAQAAQVAQITPAATPIPPAPAASTSPNPNAHISVYQDPDDPDQVIIRTRKRKRKKRQSTSSHKRMHPALKVLLIVLAALVVLAAAAAVALAIAVHQGNINLHQLLDGSQSIAEAQDVSTQDQGNIVEYKGHTYRYNENIASVVVIGHDDESSQGFGDKSLADTIVLFTIDTSTNKVRATVVPRNSWVPVDVYDEQGELAGTSEMQITLAHGVNLPTVHDWAANTVKSVSRVFYNLPISYYLDFGGDVVANASTAVGGVQLQALETIPGASYQAGDEVLLEGDDAFKYVQYREVEKDESALDRQERQVQFMRAFASKVVSLGPQGLLNVYNSVSDGIATNLGASEVAYLASCFASGNNAELEIVQLKGETVVGREADGIEYERYMLDADDVMQNTLAAFYTQID